MWLLCITEPVSFEVVYVYYTSKDVKHCIDAFSSFAACIKYYMSCSFIKTFSLKLVKTLN